MVEKIRYKACKPTQMEVVDYTVAYIYGRQRKGAHEWMIEFKNPPRCITIQKALDESIQSLNSDYEAKRYNNMT
jgi:hypothetical protein